MSLFAITSLTFRTFSAIGLDLISIFMLKYMSDKSIYILLFIPVKIYIILFFSLYLYIYNTNLYKTFKMLIDVSEQLFLAKINNMIT